MSPETDTRWQPTFVIAGAARAGSTALSETLRAHPDVWLTQPKEPHYLAFAGEEPAFSGPGDAETINRVAVTDPAAYRELYRGGETRAARGDASVSTLYYADVAGPRLKELNPEAKVVLVLRDPVDRAFSSHQYLRNRGFEPEPDFLTAVADEPRRIEQGWHHLWHYTAMSRYADDVERLREVMGADQVGIWWYDDMVAPESGAVEEVHRFLGLDPAAGAEAMSRVNASGRERSAAAAGAMHAASRSRVLRSVVKTVVPFGVRERIRNLNLKQSDTPRPVRTALLPVLGPDLDRLEQVIGREVPGHWRR
jgi:hypothetical protein